MDAKFIELFTADQFVTSFDIGKDYIFVLSGYTIFKLDKKRGGIVRKHDLFQKDGQSRSLIADDAYIYCKDFCDLHILEMETLKPVQKLRLGADLSSDIGDMHVDEGYVYLSIRNGAMIKLNKRGNFEYKMYPVTDSSIWNFVIRGDCIYAGNVNGKLFVIDKTSMDVVTEIESGKQNLKSILITDGLLITASQDKKIIVRDVMNYAIIKSLSNAHKKAFAIIGNYENQIYTICYRFGEIKVWDAESWKLNETLNFPGALTGEARIEGKRLYLASRGMHGLVYTDL